MTSPADFCQGIMRAFSKFCRSLFLSFKMLPTMKQFLPKNHKQQSSFFSPVSIFKIIFSIYIDFRDFLLILLLHLSDRMFKTVHYVPQGKAQIKQTQGRLTTKRWNYNNCASCHQDGGIPDSSLCPPTKINNFTAIHEQEELWESTGVHLQNFTNIAEQNI